MSKLILMLSALVLSQAANAMTNDEHIRPRVDGLADSELVYSLDAVLEIQRQQMVAEMQRSLRSSLIIDSSPAVAVSRPSSRIDNRQF